MSLPYTIVPEGVRLSVLLSSKASKDEVGGMDIVGEAFWLRARVRALPEKGLANKALIKLIAKWLDVRKSDIEVVSGAQARYKVLLISGDCAVLLEKLKILLETS